MQNSNRVYIKNSLIMIISKRFYCRFKKCYEILGVKETSSQNEVRLAYLTLVKMYHPDKHPELDSNKFFEIDNAFKQLQEKFAKERRGLLEDEEIIEEKNYNIKHTAPQHRQYLSFDGIGYGTVSQREKQYQNFKAMKAQERVLEHRIQKNQTSDNALMTKTEYYKKHAIKTKYGLDRVVEDLIQEAMSKGKFSNLSGTGKPLNNYQSQNPYVDFITYKINNILIDGGFIPEWIMLQKEIRLDIENMKKEIQKIRSKLGPFPLVEDIDKEIWNDLMKEKLRISSEINRKIDNYNLIVPILDKQMFRLNFEDITTKILKSDNYSIANNKNVKIEPKYLEKKNSDTIFSFISSFFEGK